MSPNARKRAFTRKRSAWFLSGARRMTNECSASLRVRPPRGKRCKLPRPRTESRFCPSLRFAATRARRSLCVANWRAAKRSGKSSASAPSRDAASIIVGARSTSEVRRTCNSPVVSPARGSFAGSSGAPGNLVSTSVIPRAIRTASGTSHGIGVGALAKSRLLAGAVSLSLLVFVVKRTALQELSLRLDPFFDGLGARDDAPLNAAFCGSFRNACPHFAAFSRKVSGANI